MHGYHPTDTAFTPPLNPPMPSTIASQSHDSTVAPPSASASRKARFWDRIANQYAADPIADMAGYEATLRRVQSLLSVDQAVLEIGCGTGSTALRLAPLTQSFLATDVSTHMIAIAQKKLAAEPVSPLRFALADADAPVFGRSEYDVALAFSVLHLVSDLDHSLALVAQALRPGGLLISKTPCVADMNPLIPYVALPLMRALGKAPHVLCFKEEALLSAITRQGMEIVSIERHGTLSKKDIRVFIVARKLR